ncbi:MAG TPA: hypothetical protein VIU85_08365, partial [Chthoniobacterales bacterium]
AWNETDRTLPPMGRLRARSRPGGSVRVIPRLKGFYGSNRVDRHYTLRYRFGALDVVHRKTTPTTSRAGDIVGNSDADRRF